MNAGRLGDPGGTSSVWQRADTLVCIAVFGFTVWYCASAPYNLYVYDEGVLLYEAKRVLNGDLLYRDFFDLGAPLAWYVMAAAYWLFGVSMATARTTMAVVHGGIAVGMVVACRTLGVRTSLAAVAALAETAICYMAIERVAPHWFGTFFCVALLVALLRWPLTVRRNAFLAGLLVGALSLTQQQRGMAMAWVPLLVVVLDQGWLAAGERSWRKLIENACCYAAGVSVVVVPVMLAFVVFAGFENVWIALVQYPLINYRSVIGISWGAYNPVQDPYMGPIFKYLSLAIPVLAAVGCAWLWRTQGRSTVVRLRVVALLVSLGALLGITYVSQYAYIVLAGPVWFVLIADLLEAGLQRAERRSPRGWLVPTAVASVLALFLGIRLLNRRLELNVQWSFVGETPFGQIAFANESDTAMLEAVKEIVGTPAELFIYPTAPGLYLLTGAENISRFQILIPGYSSPEHVQEVLDLLESRRQPFVIRNWIWMRNDIDPILPYLKERYEKVKLPGAPKQIPMMTLYRRKPESPGAQAF